MAQLKSTRLHPPPLLPRERNVLETFLMFAPETFQKRFCLLESLNYVFKKNWHFSPDSGKLYKYWPIPSIFGFENPQKNTNTGM